jgi:uncharacterized iron-regulated protein
MMPHQGNRSVDDGPMEKGGKVRYLQPFTYSMPFLHLKRLFTGLLCVAAVPAALAFTALPNDEQLFDVNLGAQVKPSDLLDALNLADVSVLGEIHDNPRHHALRAELLTAWRPTQLTVVAEHLDAGQLADPRLALLDALTQAGFDADGWQWPMHQALFEAIRQSRLPLYGGNLPAGQTREVFKSQGQSVSAGLQALLQRSTLDETRLKQLRQEIDVGHCSALPAHMFDAMIAVQRARDASMASVLIQHAPSVLLAGNGHAWKHLGVPQIIQANRPELRSVSVLFLEHSTFQNLDEQATWLEGWQGKADFIWVTPARTRDDPCQQFQKK